MRFRVKEKINAFIVWYRSFVWRRHTWCSSASDAATEMTVWWTLVADFWSRRSNEPTNKRSPIQEILSNLSPQHSAKRQLLTEQFSAFVNSSSSPDLYHHPRHYPHCFVCCTVNISRLFFYLWQIRFSKQGPDFFPLFHGSEWDVCPVIYCTASACSAHEYSYSSLRWTTWKPRAKFIQLFDHCPGLGASLPTNMTFHKAIRRQTFQARRKHLSWCRQNESVKQIRDVCFSLIDALTLNSYLNYQCKNCFFWSFESPNESVRSRSAFIQLVFSADSGSSTVMSRILDCGRIRWRKKKRRHAIKGRLKSSPQPSNIDILFVHWIARYRQNNPSKTDEMEL